MREDQTLFTKMIDEIIELGEDDPELKEMVQWVDKQAWKKGITFYDMMYTIMYRQDERNNAKEVEN